MINFKKIQANTSEYLYFLKIYDASFPPEERRSHEQLLWEMEQPNAYVGVLCNPEPIGIFIYWDFEKFVYVGHFAVDENQRGKGIGEEYLSQFVQRLNKPAILEVEKPENPMAVRRIGFYQRLGFTLSTRPYIQPAYSPEKEDVPLYLMEYPNGTLTETHFEEVVEVIHREVYLK